MECYFCPNKYETDLDLNTHLLFEHGKLRPMCSTKLDEKKLQIAELMKGDFDHMRKNGAVLNCYYILYKMDELGIKNLRRMYKRGKRLGTDKRGYPIFSRIEIPLSSIKKELEKTLFKDSYQAAKYNERYSLNRKADKDFENLETPLDLPLSEIP